VILIHIWEDVSLSSRLIKVPATQRSLVAVWFDLQQSTIEHIFPSTSDTFCWFSQKRKFPFKHACLFEHDINFFKQTKKNFTNRKLQCPCPFIQSFPCPLLLLGVTRGSSLKRTRNASRSTAISDCPLDAHQSGTWQGRRCSHARWYLDDLRAVFSWMSSAELASPICSGTFWTHGRTNVAGICWFL